MPLLPKKNNIRGQMLLSIIIAIAVFSILAHALFTLIASSFDLVSFNKSRITARHIAQEKIELIRNLPYGEVATIDGIPAGTLIAQSETINRNGLNYTVNTDIIFVDDPYDGLAPEDTSPEDYKRARIEVLWEGLARSGKNPIVLVSDISANVSSTLEGGSLIIQVVDANGDPIPQAQVSIIADSITPAVNITQSTDSEGKIILPGATECIECYRINVNKSGMSTDRTYSASEVVNPTKPNASIFTDQVTRLSFAIDLLGSMTISSFDSRENNFTPLGNTSFRLHGSKIIGTDAYAQPIYKYDRNLLTDGSGNINLSGMEWDVYYVVMPETTVNDISGTLPLLPLNLSPGGSQDFDFSISPHTDNSFFITVKDNLQNLIASASARVHDDLGFTEVKTTGELEDPDGGQVLFPGLTEQIYHLTATASGFQNYANDFSISGYTKADVVLIPE